MAYSNTATITIDNTKVSGSANHTNFPMLFSGTYAGSGTDPDFRTTGNGGDIQNTDATGGASGGVTVPADFEFTSDEAGLTQLDHEIEKYNATTGEIVAWVRIPTLSYNSDTTIYIQYNDSGVTTSQENISGTWNSNYNGVWHLGESSGTRYDSTSNGNDLTDNNTVASATGQIGTGADFEDTNSEWLSITDAAQTGLDLSTNFSFRGVIKLERLPSTAGNPMKIFSKDTGSFSNRSYDLQIHNSFPVADSLIIIFFDSSNAIAQWTVNGFVDSGDVGNNVYFGISVDISTPAALIYKNTSSQTSSLSGTGSGSIQNGTASFFMGSRNHGTQQHFFDGVLDEMIVSSTNVSADWMITEYNNWFSTSTFYSVTASDGGGGTAVKDIIGGGFIPFAR